LVSVSLAALGRTDLGFLDQIVLSKSCAYLFVPSGVLTVVGGIHVLDMGLRYGVTATDSAGLLMRR
jgi:hypothetical protein